jgi:hypothetical protein
VSDWRSSVRLVDRSRSIRARTMCCSWPAAWAWPASAPADESLAVGRRVRSSSGPPIRRSPPGLAPHRVGTSWPLMTASLGHRGYVTDPARYEALADQASLAGADAGGPGPHRRGRDGRLGVARLGRRSRRPPRPQRPRDVRARQPGCRSRWSRTWAVPWGACWVRGARHRRPGPRLSRGSGLSLPGHHPAGACMTTFAASDQPATRERWCVRATSS